MSRHIAPNAVNRRSRRTAVGVVFAGLGLAITGVGVYAGLTATASNTSAQVITSGTLLLTQTATGASGGLATTITDMAPGDAVNRYVTVTKGGTLAAKNLTLGVADSTVTKLTNDSTNGLHVTVTSCSIAWVQAVGTCAGTETVLLNDSALNALRTTAGTLVTGAVGSAYALKMSIALPDQNETTVNGTLPGSTIQGLTANLTWTFTVSQRDATTTYS